MYRVPIASHSASRKGRDSAARLTRLSVAVVVAAVLPRPLRLLARLRRLAGEAEDAAEEDADAVRPLLTLPRHLLPRLRLRAGADSRILSRWRACPS